jgi:hypothetical protein
MTTNFPGPAQVRLFYTTTVNSVAIQHSQQLNLSIPSEPAPGTPFDEIEPAFPAGGTPVDLQASIDAWVADMRPFYSSGAGHTIDRAELWWYDDESFDAHFVSAYTIALAGSSGGTTHPGGQSIVTMRTTNGGIFKLSFMESTIVSSGIDTGTISNANLEAIVADLEAKVYPWWGRDNGYPFVRIAHYPGINEALWKKRYRVL